MIPHRRAKPALVDGGGVFADERSGRRLCGAPPFAPHPEIGCFQAAKFAKLGVKLRRANTRTEIGHVCGEIQQRNRTSLQCCKVESIFNTYLRPASISCYAYLIYLRCVGALSDRHFHVKAGAYKCAFSLRHQTLS